MDYEKETALSVSFLTLWKNTGKVLFLRVATDSMMPMIRPGDSVKIRMVHADHVRPGDIIAYVQDNRVVVHRLLKTRRSGGMRQFWQWGDHLSGWGCFEAEAFLGKVESIHRGEALLEMNRGPWLLINRVIGFAGGIEVGIIEGVRSRKGRIAGERAMPLLRALKGIGMRFLGRIYALLVAFTLMVTIKARQDDPPSGNSHLNI